MNKIGSREKVGGAVLTCYLGSPEKVGGAVSRKRYLRNDL